MLGIERKQYVGRPTHNIASGNKAKFAEIAAVVPVVTEQQVVIIRHDDIMERATAASWLNPIPQNVSLLAK